MRIRKRQALFPSSLSPLPLSDPHLINRPPVVVQLSDAAPTTPKPSSTSLLSQQHASPAQSSLDRHQPSDQPLPLIGKSSNGCDDLSGIGNSGAHRQHSKQEPLQDEEVVRAKDTQENKVNSNNHTTRKGSAFDSDGRWCEGEKAIPLKKRRGSFESNGATEKGKAKMKTKMNKKCSTQDEEEWEEKSEKSTENVGSKKRGRGSALMEGSRCSRVNGRGWRCCQQTLVGYSLCEHHLGKGRLRSMTSVRNRSSSVAWSKKVREPKPDSEASGKESESVVVIADNDNDEDEDEKKPVIMTTKKRMKLGMVKARSISSLLGQTNTQVITTTVAAAVVDDHNNNNK